MCNKLLHHHMCKLCNISKPFPPPWHILLTHMYLWTNHMCISHKTQLVHLSCHSISKTKQGPFKVVKPRGRIKKQNMDGQHHDTWSNKKRPRGPIKMWHMVQWRSDTCSNHNTTRVPVETWQVEQLDSTRCLVRS
jgi:hypothetical protein